MKTKKFKLLATLVTLAAVTITTTIPATAQRRTTGNSNTENSVRKDENSYRNRVQEKSTFKNYDAKARTPDRSSVNQRREVQQKSASTRSSGTLNNSRNHQNPVTARSSNSGAGRRSATATRPVQRPAETKKATVPANEKQRITASSEREAANTPRRNSEVGTSRNSATERVRSNPGVVAGRSNGRESARTADRTVTSPRNNIYRHDDNDSRYTPNKNYRGSDRDWTNSYRPKNMYYNRPDREFYRHYNYNTYKHWDRNWERYRWNLNSWRDYYNGYNPYSYRYHRYYYHHPVYGHVIRKFVIRPQIFFHNRIRYYCYDGHFFRYHRGIGYILVDMPFGFTFEYLPTGFERVYINGYLYFRIGNLFFEYSGYGYRLIHFPERYFAYNDGYYNEGYHFDDDYYNY